MAVTYRDAGVDIDEASSLLKNIRSLAKSTFRSGVLGEIGGFGAFFHLDLHKYTDPVLVSSTDGVGTKVKIAIALQKHDTIGIDLVAMCANDIIVHGAAPLFFLDYLAMGRLRQEVATQIIQGISAGCLQARCALIGGETAEMPGMYQADDYDLAGFIVGVVERNRIIDGSEIAVGHRLIGIASSGLHANGYSLVRKVLLEQEAMALGDYVPALGRTLGEELLQPTRIYVDAILNLVRDFPLAGLAHITGGGLSDNLPRILPQSCQAVIWPWQWPRPPIFALLQEKGDIPDEEMWRVFNNGIGMVIAVDEDYVQEVLQRLAALQETAYCIGEIVRRQPGAAPLVYA
jgi:phosphoribosylformylglycinamidine cyclo-ligase